MKATIALISLSLFFITCAADHYSLQHIFHHGTQKYNRLHRRLDVNPLTLSEFNSYTLPPPIIDTVTRLKNRSKSAVYEYRKDHFRTNSAELFVHERTRLPNVTNRDLIISLARISSDAYIKTPGTEDWIDLDRTWNVTDDFGWEEFGLRGHVFANKKNDSIIVGLKGTSPPSYSSGTSANDKSNDNLLFSCCCGRVSWIWPTVCDCYMKTYTCNQTCLENELLDTSHYYNAAINIYYNVSALYPNSTIWMVGHSLGGALASLVGQTFGVPTVTFEAPGEKLASERLHLPSVNTNHIWHIGHTADPLFMGTCNGPTSTCWLARYAMETHCHAGYSCVYDTVTDKGWRQYIGTHRIKSVIDDVIMTYNETANCTREDDCVDCFSWSFE